MKNVQVVEVKQIQIKINMTPDQWDPNNHSSDTTRWHKSKLLNSRVAKNAPVMSVVDFYMDLARFAHEIGFGDNDVVIKLTEYLYQTKLDFPEVQSEHTIV